MDIMDIVELLLVLLAFSIVPVLISLATRIRPIRALAGRNPATRSAIILASVLLSWAINFGLYAGFAWYWANFTYTNPNLMEVTCATRAGWTTRDIWITFVIPWQLRELSCLDHVHRELSPNSLLLAMHTTTVLSLASILVAGVLTWRLHRARE